MFNFKDEYGRTNWFNIVLVIILFVYFIGIVTWVTKWITA